MISSQCFKIVHGERQAFMICKQFLPNLEVFKSNLVIDSATEDRQTASELLLLTSVRMFRFRDKDTGKLLTDMLSSFEIKSNSTGSVASRFNPLNTKRKLLYLKTSSYRAVNTSHLGYSNQSVYDISGTSRCLFSDKFKKNAKIQCGQNVQLLNVKLLVHHVSSRL